MKLEDFILPQSIVPGLQATERDDVIRELMATLATAGLCPEALEGELVKMILDRERRGSTGFGKGVAVPHVKHEKIKKMVGAIGISQGGIEFNALDKAPVYSVFLLLSPEDRPEEHLQAMERIFAHLQKEMFRKFLRQSTTVEEVLDLIREADAQRLHR